MPRPRLSLALLLAFAGLGVLLTAAPQSSSASATMNVDEIRPGMVAIGRTVFEGTRVEEFKVNILGVGSIRGPQQAEAPSPEESGAPKCCEEAPARVNTQMAWVLALSFAILLAGGTLLFRKGTA